MVNRRLVFVTSIVATAVWSFTLGVFHARRADALEHTLCHFAALDAEQPPRS
jgi:hypothetical protein